MRPDRNTNTRLLFDLFTERLGTGVAAVEGDRRHTHDEVVGLAGHHATHGIDHTLADGVGRCHEGLVANCTRVGCVDAAVVVGHADRSHIVVVGLNDSVG